VRITVVLIAINVIPYVWEVATGINFNDAESLVNHGALYGPRVTQQGEWWRIVSGGFMHGGLAHIALNMFALYQLGRFVESLLGARRFLIVYAISLVGGGIAVVLFAPGQPTVGASGAIFGLFGALLGIGVRMGSRGRSLISQVVPTLLINLVFTFAIPFISKAGHLGGLASGFAAGLALYAMRPRERVPVAVDAATGEETEAEYLPPDARPHREPHRTS